MEKYSIIDQIRRLRQEFQDHFFPKTCLNCHTEGVWLCESCRDSLFFITNGFCPFCGKLSDLFSVCGNCQNSTNIKKVFSLLKYKDPLVRKLIKSFKYRYVKDIAKEIDPLFLKFLDKYKNLIDINESAVLIPVPLHWYKKCERGFNQAEELAKIIGNILNLPVCNSLVIKNKHTKNQANMEQSARYKNLNGAFTILCDAPKNIILVDDVFTTGSTVKEIALALKSKGAENIQVITLARG